MSTQNISSVATDDSPHDPDNLRNTSSRDFFRVSCKQDLALVSSQSLRWTLPLGVSTFCRKLKASDHPHLRQRHTRQRRLRFQSIASSAQIVPKYWRQTIARSFKQPGECVAIYRERAWRDLVQMFLICQSFDTARTRGRQIGRVRTGVNTILKTYILETWLTK